MALIAARLNAVILVVTDGDDEVMLNVLRCQLTH